MTITANGVTYLRMADSIDPGALPAGLDAYAGYDNGAWADYPAIAAAHPTAFLLDFTVFFRNTSEGGDFEPGDMPPADAVPWYQERAAAKVWRPVLYASIGGYMPTIAQNLKSAAVPRSNYRLLSAHYGWGGTLPGLTRGQHICGPQTCGSPIQCDGTQWIDHGGWDESLLVMSFFGTPPVPPPAPPTDYPGDNVKATPITFAISGGNGWAPSPVPAASVITVTPFDENPETVGRYDNVPLFRGVASQPSKDAPNGALVFSGFADGTYGAVVWSAT